MRYYPKFNLGQVNAYKLMFAIELSMGKRMIMAAGFGFLYAINAFRFNMLKVSLF